MPFKIDCGGDEVKVEITKEFGARIVLTERGKTIPSYILFDKEGARALRDGFERLLFEDELDKMEHIGDTLCNPNR